MKCDWRHESLLCFFLLRVLNSRTWAGQYFFVDGDYHWYMISVSVQHSDLWRCSMDVGLLVTVRKAGMVERDSIRNAVDRLGGEPRAGSSVACNSPTPSLPCYAIINIIHLHLYARPQYHCIHCSVTRYTLCSAAVSAVCSQWQVSHYIIVYFERLELVLCLH